MNILSVDSLSKGYGDKTLFEGLSFGLDDGEKVAIIGKNGSGKSTLLKIIAGEEFSDGGKAVVRSSARMIYLPQEPDIDPSLTPIDYVLSGRQDILDALDRFRIITDQLSNIHSSSSSSIPQKKDDEVLRGDNDLSTPLNASSTVENYSRTDVWNVQKPFIGGEMEYPKSEEGYPNGEKEYPKSEEDYPNGEKEYPKSEKEYPNGVKDSPYGEEDYPKEKNKNQEVEDIDQNILNDQLMKVQDFLDAEGGWDIRRKAEKYLEKLGVTLPDVPVRTFSGGEKKRVAIAKALIAEPDFLLLDEPTNHLDVDTVQWLQDVITGFGMTILFITHDRYFLDSVATRILELDEGVTTSFPGNYEQYLTKKTEMQRVEAATLSAKQKKLRTELEWLRRGAKARRTKAKSRVDDISILREEAVVRVTEEMDIRPGSTYLGGQILEAHNITKIFGGKKLIDSYNYVAQPNQRIGIIGKNGSGKSTLLNMLAGELKPDSGYVTIGQTVVIGFFKQAVEGIEKDMTVVENVKMIADHFKYGYKHEERVTAEDLLDRFMFTRKMQRSKASVLSGGELKRLALLRVLIKNPNVLFMDEPTNDFDLQTLAALEDYLDLFGGVLITISHDRAFLDRCVEYIWSFEGSNIKEYPGNYSAYLSKKEEKKQEASEKSAEETKKKAEKPIQQPKEPKKKVKLSYKEQREYDGLMDIIDKKESERGEIRKELAEGDPADYQRYGELSEKLETLGGEIDELEMRWLELGEKMDGGE
jgi:ATP-binding cassette subfamily F protein uup